MREPVRRNGANPCVEVYGPDPAGRSCSTCALLMRAGSGGRYFKCKLRVYTHGPGSDHRKFWPACAKYDPGTPTQEA